MSRGATRSLAELNGASLAGFVAALGGIFEHSPWVAEAVYPQRPFADLEVLHRAMCAAVQAAPRERRLELIARHPRLEGRSAGRAALSAASRSEQASAGLDACSPEEVEALRRLNHAYHERFGFPFVMAVKGSSPARILAVVRERLTGTPEHEFETALEEIAKIARLRLQALLSTDG